MYRNSVDLAHIQTNEYANVIFTYYHALRYWTPGSRSSAPNDLKYLYYGFAFLQDMIENAFIQLTLNISVPDGLFLQQFPYPCFRYDKCACFLNFLLPFHSATLKTPNP